MSEVKFKDDDKQADEDKTSKLVAIDVTNKALVELSKVFPNVIYESWFKKALRKLRVLQREAIDD